MSAHPCLRLPLARALAGLLFSLCAGAAPGFAAPVLRAPAAGATLWSNAPTLAWEAAAAERLEVWIDGRRAECLPGNATTYVPFPLSFGEHRWHVVAETARERTVSAESTFTVADRPLAPLPPGALLLRDHWRVCSALTAGTDGRLLSTQPPAAEAPGWAATSLPATALGALVRAGTYPNPYFGANNLRIPDASDAFNTKHDLLRFSHLPGANPWGAPYWFITDFAAPAPLPAGRRLWLNFGELNYRAEIWVNGTRVATPLAVVGSDRPFRFDITALVRAPGPNHLAVAVHPVDVAGEPAPPPTAPLAAPGRNMGEDGLICHNYTRWSSLGWDWLPAIRDRNLGLTEDVYLSTSGDLEITDCEIVPQVVLGPQPSADIVLELELTNHAAPAHRATLTGAIVGAAGRRIAFSHACSVPPGTSTLRLTPAEIPQLHLAEARLWWPAGEGEQPLYRLELELDSGREPPAAFADSFGLRQVETYLRDGNRVFRINGRELYLRGGNWVNDMMGTWTATRFDRELALTRHARLNCLRVWGPDGVPPRAFFDAADREGILVWQDFLHDHWGTFNNRPGYEPDLNLFLETSAALIRRLRNHPSLFLWCGGNEGPNPRERALRDELLPALDHGRRHYLESSLSDGLRGGGPYHNLPPAAYFTHPKLADFNSEVGPSGVPEWESLRKFLTLPPPDWAPQRFPLGSEWAYHDATDQPGGDPRKFSTYDSLLRRSYGAPAGTDLAAVRAYSWRTQLVNADAYRSALEALNRKLWRTSTGFALWKSNAAWPSLTWQLYDWYLQPHAGFYAVRRTGEPVHLQLDRDTRRITLVNRTPAALADVRIRGQLQDLAGRPWWDFDRTVAIAAATALTTDLVAPPTPAGAVLQLAATDAAGRPLSSNFYWLSDTDDFTALAAPSARTTIELSATRVPGQPRLRVRLHNPGPRPAVLVRLQLRDAATDLEVLPTEWSDNYIGLLPGAALELEATTAPADFPTAPRVWAEGYNTNAVDTVP